MNRHIELVKKWLADPESVSQQELKDNAAFAYYYAALVMTEEEESTKAAHSAYCACCDAVANDAAVAARWVKKYEELTNG